MQTSRYLSRRDGDGAVARRVRLPAPWLPALGAVAVLGGLLPACPAPAARPGEVQIVEDADRRSSAEPIAARSTIFDGAVVRLRAARGETVGITVWHRGGAPVELRFAEPAAQVVGVAGFEVQWAQVPRPSTAMYGGSRGAAAYPDTLVPAAAPESDPAYFDLAVSSDAAPGVLRGELRVGTRRFAVELAVAPVLLPAPGARPWVWAYYDPRELAWRRGAEIDGAAAFADEERCAALFRAHGVMATPELSPEEWPRRRALVEGARYVPVLLPAAPAELAAAEAFWSATLAPTDQQAFAIPIDEPRTGERRRQVRALGEQLQAARAARMAAVAGGGSGGTGNSGGALPSRLLLAVTAAPDPSFGDAVDIYISPRAISRFGREQAAPARTAAGVPAARWTYNGNPPFAGSMVVDAGNADLRTWGWIGWRWQVPLWYVWDALYWHDRHNAARAGLPRPGRALTAADSVTFDDGDDHGNRDGVLALPGPASDASYANDASASAPPCLSTLRLKALRRGLTDRLLLEAASCTPESRRRAADLAASLIPFALADAFAATWQRPIPAARWSEARGQLLDLAAACTPYR